MKRILLICLAFYLFIAPVFGSGQSDEGSGKEETKKIRMMWWGSQTRHERTVKVIDLYTQQTGVEVVYEFAGWDDYWTKLTTMAAGKNLPDIMQIDINQMTEWSSRGLLQPVNAFIEKGILDLSDVPKSALAGGLIDGKQVATPLGINSQVIAVDVDMFKKAGIPIPSDEWTWKEFEETVLKLHDKLGVWGFGTSTGNDEIFKSYLLSSGLQPFGYEKGGLGYESDEVILDLINRSLRLQEAGAIPHISVELSDYSSGDNVERRPTIEGKAAMSYFWSNQLNAFWTAAGGPEKRNFELVMLPRRGNLPGNYVKPAMFFAVTRDSANPEVAAGFINFFTNSIEAHTILNADRGVPVASSVQKAMIGKLAPSDKIVFEYMARVSQKGGTLPAPAPQGWTDLLENVYKPIVRDGTRFGEYTPAEAAKIFRKEADEILKPTK